MYKQVVEFLEKAQFLHIAFEQAEPDENHQVGATSNPQEQGTPRRASRPRREAPQVIHLRPARPPRTAPLCAKLVMCETERAISISVSPCPVLLIAGRHRDARMDSGEDRAPCFSVEAITEPPFVQVQKARCSGGRGSDRGWPQGRD
jgi:hypothetical protein